MSDDCARVPTPEEIKRNEEHGFWRRDGLLADLLRLAADSPEKDAVVDRNGRTTYRALASLVESIASALLAKGVTAGDRVAVQLPNWTECMAIHLAIEAIGAVSVPLPPIYHKKEVSYILHLTEAVAVFVAIEFRGFKHLEMVEELRHELPKLNLIVALGTTDDRRAGALSWSEFLASPRDRATRLDGLKPDPNSLLEIAFTSGSTGEPKGVMHTSNTLTIEDITHAHVCDLTSSDAIFLPSTLGHQLGFSVGLRLPILIGAKVVYLERWDAREAVEIMARENVTYLVTTPTFLIDVLDAPNLAAHGGLPKLRIWQLVGAVVTSALHERVRDRMPHVRLVHAFGMTEVGAMIFAPASRPAEKSLATGLPQRGLEIRVLNDEGEEVARNVEGQLAMRSPSLFLGYYKRPDLTKASFTPDGFFLTGDRVMIDDDAYVYVTGRIKDVIKRGGENLSPAEIEEVVARHPSVAEVAVVGSFDERLGERVCAFVVTRSQATLDLPSLSKWMESVGLARQKWPERLEIVTALPKTSIGKIHKAVLRAWLADGSGGHGAAQAPGHRP